MKLSKAAKRRLSRITRFSKEIEAKNYASDAWLKLHWKDCLDKDDAFNYPYKKYIPDLINLKWKYIIECDGPIHDSRRQIKHDARRNIWLKNEGFTIFRVKHGDWQTLQKIKSLIRDRRRI